MTTRASRLRELTQRLVKELEERGVHLKSDDPHTYPDEVLLGALFRLAVKPPRQYPKGGAT